mmetsp:Transcript_81845/g.226810  ORF Transcript_81845/g.226810 Transcript_81845/m.226810 type:complete len:244 (-) Transcript_81845:519-1250(-)
MQHQSFCSSFQTFESPLQFHVESSGEKIAELLSSVLVLLWVGSGLVAVVLLSGSRVDERPAASLSNGESSTFSRKTSSFFRFGKNPVSSTSSTQSPSSTPRTTSWKRFLPTAMQAKHLVALTIAPARATTRKARTLPTALVSAPACGDPDREHAPGWTLQHHSFLSLLQLVSQVENPSTQLNPVVVGAAVVVGPSVVAFRVFAGSMQRGWRTVPGTDVSAPLPLLILLHPNQSVFVLSLTLVQ